MPLKICISGLTAVGKTTIAQALARRYNAQYISASSLLLKLAQEHDRALGTAENINHFWLQEKGKDLFTERERNFALDREIDQGMLSLVEASKNLILDSLTLPYRIAEENNAFCILLCATLKQRTDRAWLSSPTMPKYLLRKGIKEKDVRTRKILQALWGIDIFRPRLAKYDLIISDGGLGKLFNHRPSANEEITIKLEIFSALLDIYVHLVEPEHIKHTMEELVEKCRQVYQRCEPIIKVFPHGFLSAENLMGITWRLRRRGL